MTISKRKNSEFYHFDFRYRGVRYQGSTGERDKRAAQRHEAAYKKEVKSQVGSSVALPTATRLSASTAPTVGALAQLLASSVRSSRHDAEFYSNLDYLTDILGVDRPIDQIGEGEIARLILSEKIKGLLFHLKRRKHTAPIETLLPDEFKLAGDFATEAELANILDILIERGAESQVRRTPLGVASMIKNFARPINALRRLAREMGTPLPKLENLRDKAFGKYGRNRLLTTTEEMILRESCEPWRMEIYDFAMQSMLRLTNIVNLRWQEVDIGNRRIHVKVKFGKSFHRFINDAMLKLILAQKDRHPVYVFTKVPAYGTGRIPLTDHISDHFTEDTKSAGILDITFHDLRRTGATRMYDADHDIEAVRTALGHKNASTTWGYIVSSPGNIERTEIKRAARDRAAASAARAMLSGNLLAIPTEGELLVAIQTKAHLDAASVQAVVAAISADAALLTHVALFVARWRANDLAIDVDGCSESCSDSPRRKTPKEAETLLIASKSATLHALEGV